MSSAIDQLPGFGRAIATSLVPTFTAYAPLHEANRSAIESIPREEFAYGTHPRQKLDLYTPRHVTNTTPILLFVYGGGLSRGDKRLPSPPTAKGLVYANIAQYFCSRNFITCIPDYRRTGENGSFPSGGEDIAATLLFLQLHYPSGTHAVHIMGNSAGAVHTATWLLSNPLAQSRRSATSTSSGGVVVRGAVLVSIPAQFRKATEDRAPVLKAYYGDRVEEDCALGLVAQASSMPPVRTLVVTGTLDPEDEIVEPSEEFVQAWKERFGEEMLTVKVLEGHNHFSTVMALGTGDEREESLGSEVLKWMGVEES